MIVEISNIVCFTFLLIRINKSRSVRRNKSLIVAAGLVTQ